MLRVHITLLGCSSFNFYISWESYALRGCHIQLSNRLIDGLFGDINDQGSYISKGLRVDAACRAT